MNMVDNTVTQDGAMITVSNEEYGEKTVLQFASEEIADEVMFYLIRDGEFYSTEQEYYTNALVLNEDDLAKCFKGANIEEVFAGYKVTFKNNNEITFDGTLSDLIDKYNDLNLGDGMADYFRGWFTQMFETGDYKTSEATIRIADAHAAERTGELNNYIEDHNLYKKAYLFTHGPVVEGMTSEDGAYSLSETFGKDKNIVEDNYGIFQYFNDARDVIDTELKEAQYRCFNGSDKFEYFGGIKEIELPINEWYEIENGFHEGIYDGDPFQEYDGAVLYTALLNKDSSISIEDRSTLAHDVASSQQKYQSATFWYEMSQNKDINNER